MQKKSTKVTAAASTAAAEEPGVSASLSKEPKTKKSRAKKSTLVIEPEPAANETQSAAPPVDNAQQPSAKPAKKKRASPKPRSAKVAIKDEAGAAAQVTVPLSAPVADPIGDVSDGEAHAAVDIDVPYLKSEAVAMAEALADEIHENELPELPPQADHAPQPPPPAKLERLQKILSQAGIASRRHAEEMIVAGRVMVNGQLVTQLGAKADPERDHIRVDGKLITGAERHRYFVLNKPRGYVTTVSDPEGRPTVMQFFEKLNQRLYPVGRLDYLSEGLLLVTNDGELANQLTRAAAGVEKTYVVKVAGQPTPQELERLRSGVSIERGTRGTERVDTAPAQVREIRRGDNPWFEVVLIEGRNRELRKMFEQIGHHVEKIRRVRYGPLVLDVEPGTFRELTAEEVAALRLAAEGKLKPRRPRTSQMLPKDAGRPAPERETKRGDRRSFARQSERPAEPSRFGGKPGFKPRPAGDKRDRGAKPAFKPRFDNRSAERFGGRAHFSNLEGEQRGEPRPFQSRHGSSRPFRGREESDTGRVQRFEQRNTGFRPQQRSQDSEDEGLARREFGPRSDKPQFKRGGKPAFKRGGKPTFNRGGKPGFKRSDRPAFKPGGQGASNRGGQSRFKSDRPALDRGSKPAFDRGSKPAFKRNDRPPFKRDNRPPFQRSGEADKPFESRPSRPPGRTFGGRPAGKPGSRPSSAKSSGASSSGRKFGPGAPRKPGSRPAGKFKPRSGDRKRY